MKDNPISRLIPQFFDNLKSNTTLLFTTFPLDEAVFAELLNQHKNQVAGHTIIVLHDIMAHRHWGYLEKHTDNIKILPVELSIKSASQHCPVFHSKIWAEIDEKRMRLEQLLVSSANLSRFHFDNNSKTLDMGCLWGREQINPGLPDFIKIILRKRDSRRFKCKPVTLLLETRTKRIKLSISKDCVGKLLQKYLPQNKESLKYAAPFINIEALKKISISPKVYQLKKNKREHLHAKFIAGTDIFLWGSPNWTKQALWGFDQDKAFNHETLVISSAGPEFKGWFAEDKSEPNKDEEDSIQEELEGDIGADWAQEKEWATMAPVTLKLDKKGYHAVLTWDKLDSRTRFVKIYDTKLKINARTREYIIKSKNEVKTLALHFLQNGKFEAIGLDKSGKTPIWKREVELPATLWKKRGAISKDIMTSFGNGNNATNNEHQKSIDAVNCYEDVRDLRKQEIEFLRNGQPQLADHYFWSSWLAHSSCIAGTQKWCIDFAKKLSLCGSGDK